MERLSRVIRLQKVFGFRFLPKQLWTSSRFECFVRKQCVIEENSSCVSNVKKQIVCGPCKSQSIGVWLCNFMRWHCRVLGLHNNQTTGMQLTHVHNVMFHSSSAMCGASSACVCVCMIIVITIEFIHPRTNVQLQSIFVYKQIATASSNGDNTFDSSFQRTNDAIWRQITIHVTWSSVNTFNFLLGLLVTRTRTIQTGIGIRSFDW